MTSPSQGNVLLFILPQREPAAAVREAITAAKSRGGRLLVAAALDPELVDQVAKTLTDSAFVGEKVSDDLQQILRRESRHQAESVVAAIVQQAEREGVPTESTVEEGDPTEICTRLVRTHQIALAILVAERRSWLTRLLSGHAVRVPELAGCEVRVMEEE